MKKKEKLYIGILESDMFRMEKYLCEEDKKYVHPININFSNNSTDVMIYEDLNKLIKRFIKINKDNVFYNVGNFYIIELGKQKKKYSFKSILELKKLEII